MLTANFESREGSYKIKNAQEYRRIGDKEQGLDNTMFEINFVELYLRRPTQVAKSM